MVLPMLKHEDTILFQQPLLKDQRGNRRELFQRIRWIGKDEIKLLLAGLDESEGITAKGEHPGTEHTGTVPSVSSIADYRGTVPCVLQFLETLLDEPVMIAIHLDADHLRTASGNQFQSNATRAREKVKGGGIFEVDVTIQHIEDILLGEISGWSCLEGLWDVEMPPLI